MNKETLKLQPLYPSKNLEIIKLPKIKSIVDATMNIDCFLKYINYNEDMNISFSVYAEKNVLVCKISYKSTDDTINSINKTMIKSSLQKYNTYISKRNKILAKLATLNSKLM